MIVYRHKIWFKNIRKTFADGDFENIKMVALFLATLGVMTFFSFRIVETLNQGIEAQSRTEKIETQVAQLEKENQFLKSQKDIAMSDAEIEAQYRALGNKKPGESVYIVSKVAPSLSASQDFLAEESSSETSKSEEPNWQKWFIVIFKN